MLLSMIPLTVLPTVNAMHDTYQPVYDYCLAHADKVLAGGNPVADLIKTGLISLTIFEGKTCQDVKYELTQAQAMHDLFGGRLDVD